MITPTQLAQLAPACDAANLAPALSTAAENNQIDTVRRLANWLGQLFVESAGFTRFEENLNYSAQPLCAVWPNRFPNLVAATPFAHNPEALANKVYGGRLGNTEPDDGWTYRGRGMIQITGRDNYQRYGDKMMADLIAHPDLAAHPAVAAEIAGAYWVTHGLNESADIDDIEIITRAINGGTNGLEDRKQAVARAKSILGLQTT